MAEKRKFRCADCGRRKTLSAFYTKKNSRLGHFKWCKKCQGTRTRRWHKANRKAHLKLGKARKWALKLEAIKHYGGRCTCCGEAEPKFLELDHKNNDGAIFRRVNGKWLLGADFVRWLKKNNWPKNVQLHCSNCNNARQRYGICPHQESK